MKHILNDLTEQEKNAIREQHTGGMKIINEKFSKLLNSKLGDVKPLVSEQTTNVGQTILVYKDSEQKTTPYKVVIQGQGKKVGYDKMTLEFPGHVVGQSNQVVQIQCSANKLITVYNSNNNVVLQGYNKDVIGKFCSSGSQPTQYN